MLQNSFCCTHVCIPWISQKLTQFVHWATQVWSCDGQIFKFPNQPSINCWILKRFPFLLTQFVVWFHRGRNWLTSQLSCLFWKLQCILPAANWDTQSCSSHFQAQKIPQGSKIPHLKFLARYLLEWIHIFLIVASNNYVIDIYQHSQKVLKWGFDKQGMIALWLYESLWLKWCRKFAPSVRVLQLFPFVGVSPIPLCGSFFPSTGFNSYQSKTILYNLPWD